MNSLPPGLNNSASKAKAKTLPMPTFTLPYNFTDFQRTEAENFNPQQVPPQQPQQTGQQAQWANQSDQYAINTPNSKRKLSLEMEIYN